MTVRHKNRPDLSLLPDDPLATVKLSYWNEDHELAGGIDGDIVTRDPGQVDGQRLRALVGAGGITITVGGTTLTIGIGTLLQLLMPVLAAPTNTAPGADKAKFEIVVSTGGTAKLLMYAGTSSAPVTIADLVGGGVAP